MTATIARRLEALERASDDAPRLLVLMEEPTPEQLRAIEAAERSGSPLLVIRLVFG